MSEVALMAYKLGFINMDGSFRKGGKKAAAERLSNRPFSEWKLLEFWLSAKL